MKIPEFPQFRVITISDREVIENIDKDFDDYSDFNFVSLFAWNVNKSAMFSVKSGNLIIKLRDYGSRNTTYSIIGKSVDDKILREIKDIEHCSRLELVPEPIVKKLKTFNSYEDRDNFDYIYDIKRLANLEGPEYRKFRRALSNFKSKNSASVGWEKLLPNDTESINQIIELSKEWKRIRNRSFSESSNEYYAIKRAIKYAEELGLEVWCIKSESGILGYAIIEIRDDSCILHFEKCDTRIPGLGYYLKYRTICTLKENGIKELNYEQDLGIPGLRQSKESMNPQKYLKKYSVSL